ncbi:helix-turn-helix transcriptional regulator [Actinocrinis puniceicyclus]|uniref:Helix-turn-helix transcriptional regulator n=1 Tax=Actinocrinis puniceicyclus TaxID=977794 RepID=A0A8J7WH44_9ACTN|nr:helix-turn-helix transcriptional regulator [Actinocrinis puniceicyclus]MBS2962146.1 helix-turn-helix transcriptional regulator [Actinocrinis puniceicyclus]
MLRDDAHPGGLPAGNEAIYVISVAAELSGLHPQTLRQYDRLGLVSPDRAPGRGRRYSARDIERLREVQRLSQDEGVNLAGIKRIRELQDQVDALSARVAELEESLAMARATSIPLAVPAQQPDLAAGTHAASAGSPAYRPDLLPALPAFGTSTALVVWKPQQR